MRVYNVLIPYFLLIYLCYAHDLNHIDSVPLKQSESTSSKNIETTNVQKNDNTYEPRVQTTQESRQVPDSKSQQNDKQYTTPSVDNSLKNSGSSSIPSDLSTPSTPLQTQANKPSIDTPSSSKTIKNIPISNDNSNVKTHINSPPIQTIQQKKLEEEKTVLNDKTTQSPHQEQIKPISDHIPSSATTQQPTPNIIQNSNSFNVKTDQPSQVPVKPTVTTTSDTVIVQPESHIPIPTTSKVLRSATPKVHVQPRQDQVLTDDLIKKDISQTENKITKESNDGHKHSIESQKPHIATTPRPVINPTNTNDENVKPVNNIDLPRQVRVHHSATILDQQDTSNVSSLNDDSIKSETLIVNKEIENVTTGTSVLINDVNAHLPRTLENDEKSSINNTSETNQAFIQNESKIENNNSSIISKANSILNNTLTNKTRQICWHLPNKFEPSIELLEDQLFRFINILPEFVQTIFFGRIDDREVLMNTMWLGSVCTMCILFSFLFLSLGTKRLKQSKKEKEIRARCQQLQQYNNQVELERSTFERQNQKLSDENDELKSLPVRDTDEDIFALREECTRFQDDLKAARAERDTLQQNIDYKQNLLQKHEFDMQRQVETVAYLNNEILQLKQELEKERATRSRLQSTDISLERFEKSQERIQELKSEVHQLKQDKHTQKDQYQEIQNHVNQLDIENNQLTLRMKQLKDLLEQRNQTIKRIQEKINEEKPNELEELLSIITENASNNNDQHLLTTINNDLEKSNQHIRDLHNEIDEKTRRIKELDLLFKQEKDRCKEMETKLKVILELRERDAHLHIRQLGQTDAELRKARTDIERVRILQQQLDFKQQQFDDVQKVLSAEQMKFNDECSKLQHETHEKWMEVKRLTRDLEISKKECENLRKQITKYANNERSSLEKTMIKPVPQHFGNHNELFESNGSSPNIYQQGENFRPIDHQRNDSGATSPAEMFIPRPPLFGLHRPPFFPPSFMPPPPPNAYIMHPRFPMPTTSPHGMISPLSHLMINGNDGNNFEMIDSTNITPNSSVNGAGLSSISENDKQVKTKKTKKSSKKKLGTSVVKEDV